MHDTGDQRPHVRGPLIGRAVACAAGRKPGDCARVGVRGATRRLRAKNRELWAVERWLRRNASHFPAGTLTRLGDVLHCQQLFCALVLAQRQRFVFTCKPDSHPTPYQEIDLLRNAGGVFAVSQPAPKWSTLRAMALSLRAAGTPAGGYPAALRQLVRSDAHRCDHG